MNDFLIYPTLPYLILSKCGKTFYFYQNLVKVSTQGLCHIQGHPRSFSTKIYTLLQTTCDDDINSSYEWALIGVSNVSTDSRSKVMWDHWGQKCWNLIVNSLLFPSTLQSTFSHKRKKSTCQTCPLFTIFILVWLTCFYLYYFDTVHKPWKESMR